MAYYHKNPKSTTTTLDLTHKNNKEIHIYIQDEPDHYAEVVKIRRRTKGNWVSLITLGNRQIAVTTNSCFDTNKGPSQAVYIKNKTVFPKVKYVEYKDARNRKSMKDRILTKDDTFKEYWLTSFLAFKGRLTEENAITVIFDETSNEGLAEQIPQIVPAVFPVANIQVTRLPANMNYAYQYRFEKNQIRSDYIYKYVIDMSRNALPMFHFNTNDDKYLYATLKGAVEAIGDMQKQAFVLRTRTNIHIIYQLMAICDMLSLDYKLSDPGTKTVHTNSKDNYSYIKLQPSQALHIHFDGILERDNYSYNLNSTSSRKTNLPEPYEERDKESTLIKEVVPFYSEEFAYEIETTTGKYISNGFQIDNNQTI